jgi:hypothetical protein
MLCIAIEIARRRARIKVDDVVSKKIQFSERQQPPRHFWAHAQSYRRGFSLRDAEHGERSQLRHDQGKKSAGSIRRWTSQAPISKSFTVNHVWRGIR